MKSNQAHLPRPTALDASSIAAGANCRRFVELWDHARGDRLIPTRAALGPQVLRGLLPHIVILEMRGPDTFIFRLVGTSFWDQLGMDPTGHNILDLTPPQDRPLRALRMRSVASQPCGAAYEQSMPSAHGSTLVFEGVTLPIAGEDKSGRPQLISCMSWVETKMAPVSWPPRQHIGMAGAFGFFDIGAGVPMVQPAIGVASAAE